MPLSLRVARVLGIAVSVSMFCSPGVQAQTGTGTTVPEQLQPIITGPKEVSVGKTVVLDASSSVGLGTNTEYQWYLEGATQPISRLAEAVFTPDEKGEVDIRLVLETTVNGGRIEVETTHTITVYSRKILLIADSSVPQEKITIHRVAAVDAGIYLRVLQPTSASLPVGSEEVLQNLITENISTLQGAETIVIWTEGITGLQALMSAVENDEERLKGIQNQSIVLLAERSLPILARTARGPFTVLRPDRIVLTRKEAVNPLFTAQNVDEFLVTLGQRDIDYLIVDEETSAVRPWNILSSLVNYMLTHGVRSQTVILLLLLPLIATIITFLKQVIGITTFGLFAPSIVALSFLALGWMIGLPLLIFIVTAGYLTRRAMQSWRLLYVPKVAIILTVVSITLLVVLAGSTYFGITFSRDSVFILLILSTLAENFLNVKTGEGLYSAILTISETVLAALLCVFIVQWSLLQSLLLAYPELILLTLLINIILGRWTGLRLMEYFRFREVFRHLQEE